MYILETQNLIKKFKNRLALDHLDLKVKKGHIHGLLGPNGAGKSTLISILCTLSKPTSGKAYVNNFEINKENFKIRNSIGVVFQSRSLDEILTAHEHLEMHAALYNLDKTVRNQRIKEILELTDLQDNADEQIKTFSGGMKRRLEIGRGLIHYPKILFLDEPTLGLDPQTREHIWEYIENLNQIEDVTILLTTHYLDEADKLCNIISLIDNGKIIKEDTPDNLKKNLKSDVICIRVDNIHKFQDLISSFEFVKKSFLDEEYIKLIVENGENMIPILVNAATEKNIIIKSIEVEHPKLEDVFRYYTDKSSNTEKGAL